MKALDRFLQEWRIAKIRHYIPAGSTVLDVGCADGVLFKRLAGSIRDGIGIDPDLAESVQIGDCRLIAGNFPDDVPHAKLFDAITMLAVVEHVPHEQQIEWAHACDRLLKPGGHLLITTPSPFVDPILDVLRFARLIDGMSLEQHYGFDPRLVAPTFTVGDLRLVKARKFQLGLNNVFVFQKPNGAAAVQANE